MDQFEETLELYKLEFESMSLAEMKQIQRTLTKYIDIAQGYDGGKHVKKENMNNCTTSTIDFNRPSNSPVFMMQEFVACAAYLNPVVNKEEEMINETQDQRHYLARQLQGVSYAKDVELMKSFGLTEDPTPRKGSDLIARITTGKYILRDEKSVRYADSALDYIEWRDPAVVKDQEGFEAAQKVMHKSKLDTERTIQIAAPADGLAALKAFEAMSFDKTTAPTTTTAQ